MISHEDFVQYLNLASEIEVSLSPECQAMLQAYFLINRKLRSEAGHRVDMDVMRNLVTLAMAHARLCFRNVAIMDDSLVSIMLMEESLTTRFHHSVLGFSHELPNDEENLVKLFGVETCSVWTDPSVAEGSENIIRNRSPDDTLLAFYDYLTGWVEQHSALIIKEDDEDDFGRGGANFGEGDGEWEWAVKDDIDRNI
ncbi:hypothetical protein BKA69DRAFT_8801 [Paraphysoderma sedebokerense]|nr:hypothetical protein BKA69DRAFT_8801 [Paraphysoderma sedebokerense]